jgi:hypothetical protein
LGLHFSTNKKLTNGYWGEKKFIDRFGGEGGGGGFWQLKLFKPSLLRSNWLPTKDGKGERNTRGASKD